MPPLNTWLNAQSDRSLEDLLVEYGLGAQGRGFRVSPMGQAPASRDDIANELRRRNAIRGVSGLTPEQQQMAISNDYSGIPEGGPSRNPPVVEDGFAPLPLRASPQERVAGANPMEVEGLYPPLMTNPNELPVPPDQPPASAPTRAPAGRGRSAGGRQALPIPPVPPNEEQLGPTSRPDDPTTPPMSEKDKNTWLAVLQAGLGIMGGTSTNAAVNIGQGASAGVKAYQDWEKERRQDENRVRALDIQDQYRQDQGVYMRGLIDSRIQDAENRVRIAEMRAASAGAGSAAREAALTLRSAQLDLQTAQAQARADRDAERNDPLVVANTDYNRTLRETTERLLAQKTRDITGEERPTYTPQAARQAALDMLGPEPPRTIPQPQRDQFAEVYNKYNAGTLGATPEENERLWGVAQARVRQLYPGLRDPMSLIRPRTVMPLRVP